MKILQPPRRRLTILASALSVALAGSMALALPETSGARAPAQAAEASTFVPPSFSELVERVKPAVVNVSIKGTKQGKSGSLSRGFDMPEIPGGSPFGDLFRHFFDDLPGQLPGDGTKHEFQAAGSGFIVTSDGYVVTSDHVIEHADEIEVILHDGERYPAVVRGRDPKTDLALLKIEPASELPYVEFGDSDAAKVGEWVVAVGNPFGLGGTVTAGIISARGRDIRSGPYDDYLQVDAPINRGNSGGPLFDTRGRVIGINTAIYSPSGGNVGIGFAIPSSMAGDIVAQLRDSGHIERGWLGVQIQPVTAEVVESFGLDDQHGALVASVVPDSPAAQAGIQAGDVIRRMNNELLDDFRDLPRMVAAAEAGTQSVFEVWRRGETHELSLEIRSMPAEEDRLAMGTADDTGKQPRLGIYLSELTPETRKRFGIADDVAGVLVQNVQPGSPAARAGIRTGSVIDMVDQDVVRSPDEVVARVRQAVSDKRSAVMLLVSHDGEQRFVAVRFATA